MQVEDAIAAARLGADAIGMVFYPEAKRCITRDRAREILRALPPFVTPVGLFVDEPAQAILDLAAELNLRHVQLQGNESADEVAELEGLTVLKALRMDRDQAANQLATWRTRIAKLGIGNLAGFVLETANTGVHGGSGVPNDWAFVESLQSDGAFTGLPPIIAAGGLTPQTVGDVVRRIHPWAVDVSSGVESDFGKKSDAKVAEFIREVRAADAA